MELFNSSGVMPIPRKKKDILASFGLVGKVHLESNWSESRVLEEMRSAFEHAMDGDDSHPLISCK